MLCQDNVRPADYRGGSQFAEDHAWLQSHERGFCMRIRHTEYRLLAQAVVQGGQACPRQAWPGRTPRGPGAL